jgi:hypothetical protein
MPRCARPLERPDEPLDVTVLPRRARGRATLTDAEVVDPAVECCAEDPVAVACQELEGAVLTEGCDDLLSCPLRVRMRGQPRAPEEQERARH